MRLSDEQMDVLLRGIAPHRVKSREGMSYVEAFDIRAMMNRVFGFAGWSLIETSPTVCVYEQETTLKNDKPGYNVAYRAHLSLIVHTPDGDATYAGSAVADATMPAYKRGDAHDMALKSAESGALKRAATNLGDQFGLSLYADSSLNPIVKKVVGFNTESQGSALPPAREPEMVPGVSAPGTPPAGTSGSSDPAGGPSHGSLVDKRLSEMSAPARTLFIKHLAMEHKITGSDYLLPKYETEVLAAMEKFVGAA